MHHPNPAITWHEHPLHIPTHLTRWTDTRRIAGISSFGFGGTNAHAIIENAISEGG
jgi:acyl transferase domain-containing protein